MTRRWLLLAAGIAVVAITTAAVLLSRGGDAVSGGRSAVSGGGTLESRTVTAGAVTVKIEPHHIDGSGAEFTVAFDTHSADLGFDVAKVARLTVNGTPWASPSWSGDGPGGHHRSGTLRFVSAGPAGNQARLDLTGLPAPVTAEWPLASQ